MKSFYSALESYCSTVLQIFHHKNIVSFISSKSNDPVRKIIRIIIFWDKMIIQYDWCTAFSGRPMPKPGIFTSCGRSKVGHWTSGAISIYWWPAHMLAMAMCFFWQKLISFIFAIALSYIHSSVRQKYITPPTISFVWILFGLLHRDPK